tara:strand:+ start:1710 stop:2081 length:372 start_codon:yes stop_codon:yes gene_type:complete
MFNKKYFIIFFSSLLAFVIINLFLDVKVEFLTASFVEFKQFSLNCGSVYQILIEGIEYTDKNLKMHDAICYNNAVIKVFNTIIGTIAVLMILKFGIQYIDRKTNREDLSDLLRILKFRNSRKL